MAIIYVSMLTYVSMCQKNSKGNYVSMCQKRQ